MKKILLLVVVGVVALAGGVGVAALVGSSGGANMLCVEGFNYATNLSLAEYQTSPAGPIIGVYQNQKPWLALYPVMKLSNVADGYTMTAPAFTTKAGWKVYAPKQRPADGSLTYAVDSDMPFILIGGATGATEAQMRLFLDGLARGGKCPSPNPGLLASEAEAQKESATKEMAACGGVKIAITQTKCEKFSRESVPQPGTFYTSYEASAEVKNEGTVPVSGVDILVASANGSGIGASQGVALAPGASAWLSPEFAMEKSAKIVVVPMRNSEFCFSKQVEAPISCVGLPTLTEDAIPESINTETPEVRNDIRRTDLSQMMEALIQHLIKYGEGVWGCATPPPKVATRIASNAFDLAACIVPEFIKDLPHDPNGAGAYWKSKTDYDTQYTFHVFVNKNNAYEYFMDAPHAEGAVVEVTH